MGLGKKFKKAVSRTVAVTKGTVNTIANVGATIGGTTGSLIGGGIDKITGGSTSLKDDFTKGGAVLGAASAGNALGGPVLGGAAAASYMNQNKKNAEGNSDAQYNADITAKAEDIYGKESLLSKATGRRATRLNVTDATNKASDLAAARKRQIYKRSTGSASNYF